jgi:predicted transcriptional regulator
MAKATAEALEMIKQLPDDVTTAVILEELFFKQQVEKGLQDVAEGRVLTQQELKEKNRSMAQVRWSLTAGTTLWDIDEFIARTPFFAYN